MRAAGAEAVRAAGAEAVRAAGAEDDVLVIMHPWKSARHWSIVFFEAIY